MSHAKPRVVHVIPTFGAGGAERLVYELVRELPSEGFDASAVALMGSGPMKSFFDEAHLSSTVFPRSGLFGSGSFFALRDLLRREKPDIVHTHLFGADLWGRLAALSAGSSKIVTTVHNVHPDFGFVKHGINAALARVTSSIIAVSSVVRDDLHSREHIPLKKLHVVRNGIDLSQVIERPPRPFRDIPQLIIVGRLEPQKGHEMLFQALAHVKQPWKLSIVGTGSHERELRNIADSLSIAPRIHWLGYRSDVPSLLADADLFCFPSQWEGLGLALVEAAAAGVPIIASDLKVFRDVLSPSEATYVVSKDASGFARAITSILSNPTVAVQRAHAAKENVKRRFSIEQMVSSYAKIYRQLLSRRS